MPIKMDSKTVERKVIKKHNGKERKCNGNKKVEEC